MTDQTTQPLAKHIEEVVEKLISSSVSQAVMRERAEVDELLAKRLEECFCEAEKLPCESCLEVSRIRGTLAARASR